MDQLAVHMRSGSSVVRKTVRRAALMCDGKVSVEYCWISVMAAALASLRERFEH